MKSSKATKRALFSSIISLIICFSMLVGTTFAWFTDSVSSGVNKIVAGNLDITAEYNVLDVNGNLTGTWRDLKDANSLFNGSLWEPGHTKYAVIRIKNAGTLDLKYQVKVDVVSEIGSINVNGQQFKLSDYLYYGVQYSTAEPSIDRTGAVALATAPLGAYSSDSRDLEANTGYDYMTLAITMPTNVGNEANYDKAYNAPSIDLGITVLATQKTSESDSFGPDYDQNAQYPLPTFTSTSNASFPVQNEALLAPSATQVEVTLNANTSTGHTVAVGSVTVPAGRVADVDLPVSVEVKPAEQGNFIAAAEGKDAKYYDISVSNLKADTSTGNVTVSLQLDPGLTDVVIKHNDQGTITDVHCTYNPVTGMVTFETASFSPFAIEYKCEKVAKIGEVYYSSLADAIAAANDSATIVLLKDTTVSGQIEFPAGKTMTVDLNGKTITAAGDNRGFWAVINGNVTFKGDGYVGDETHESVGYLFNLKGILTIEGDATYECGLTVVQLSSANAELYIKGGSFIGDQWNDVYWTINKIDSFRDSAKAEISGGRFYKFNPADGRTESPADDFVAIGHDVRKNGDWFEVVEKVYTFSCGAKTELNAEIPAGATVITTQAALNEALSAVPEEGATLYIGAGEFSINVVSCPNKEVTFIGAGFDKTTLKYGTTPSNPNAEAGANYCFEGSKVTFRDVTLIDGNGDDANYKGFVRCAGLTFENCVLKSRMTYLGVGDVVSFRNCTFETPKYAAWIYSSQTYNFENCLFNSPTGRFLNVFSETNIAPVINAKECRFVDSSNGSDSNAVFNIKSSSKTTLTITDCVVSGASPMYKVQSANGTVVTIDGRVVYSAS